MMIMFFLMACTTDHSFKLDEKQQIIVVHNLLVLEIEYDSSHTDEGHSFFIIKENPYDTKEFDTIRLQGQSTGLKIEKLDCPLVFLLFLCIKIFYSVYILL